MAEFLDNYLGKFISRKLFVFAISCVLMGFGLLDSGDWVMIAAIYIGGQSIIDGIAKMKGV